MLYYSVFNLDDLLLFKIVMSFFLIECYNLIITEGENRTEQKLSLEKTVEGTSIMWLNKNGTNTVACGYCRKNALLNR